MPTTTIFSTTSFDATTRHLPVITFNAAGIINNGGVGNPASLGYTAAYFDDFMERGGPRHRWRATWSSRWPGARSPSTTCSLAS